MAAPAKAYVSRPTISRSGPAQSMFKRAGMVLFPVTAFVAALAFPDTAAPDFAGLHLPVYRIFLIFLLPLALIRFARMRMRLALPDVLVMAFAALQAVALFSHYGLFATVSVERFGGGTIATNILVNAGTTFLETLGPYFLARSFVRNRADAAVVAGVLIFVTIAVGVTTLFEATTGVSLFSTAQDMVRFGLHRAAGPFPGPIQWGLFAASAFALSVAKGVVGGTPFRRAVVAVLVLGAALTSVSSAAIAAIAIQIILIAWFYLSASLRNRGWIFAAGLVGIYLFIDIFSNRTPVQVAFDYAALDPWTGYYRTLIWQYGWADFLSSPFIGIGYQDWARPRWMTPSIDAFWLVMLLRYGLLGAGPLILGIAAALQRAGRYLPRLTRTSGLDLSYCWLASVSSLLVGGFTVHFWQQSFVELFLLVGMWGAFVPAKMVPNAGGAASRTYLSGEGHRSRARTHAAVTSKSPHAPI